MLLHWHCKNSYCVKRQCIESIVKHTSLFGGLCSLGFPQGVQLPFRSPVENVEQAFEEITSGNLHIISQAGHTGLSVDGLLCHLFFVVVVATTGSLT